jgi:hypothetical protein
MPIHYGKLQLQLPEIVGMLSKTQKVEPKLMAFDISASNQRIRGTLTFQTAL